MSLKREGKRVRAAMRKKFLKVYEQQKCNASQTRQILDLGLHTFDKWMKKDAKFAAKIIEIENAMVDKIEVCLITNAEGGKQRAIEFFLTNRRSKRYKNTQRTELTGEDGGPVTYEERIYEAPPPPKVPPKVPPKQEVTNASEEEVTEEKDG